MTPPRTPVPRGRDLTAQRPPQNRNGAPPAPPRPAPRPPEEPGPGASLTRTGQSSLPPGRPSLRRRMHLCWRAGRRRLLPRPPLGSHRGHGGRRSAGGPAAQAAARSLPRRVSAYARAQASVPGGDPAPTGPPRETRPLDAPPPPWPPVRTSVTDRRASRPASRHHGHRSLSRPVGS